MSTNTILLALLIILIIILILFVSKCKNQNTNNSGGSTTRAIGCGKCAVDFDLEMKAAGHTVPQYNGTSCFNTAMLNRAINNLIICTGATVDSK